MDESLIFLDPLSPPDCDVISVHSNPPRQYGMVRFQLLVNKDLIDLADEILEEPESGKAYGFCLEISEEEGLNVLFWDAYDSDSEHYLPVEDEEESIRERVDSQALWLYGETLDQLMEKARRKAKKSLDQLMKKDTKTSLM